MARRRSWLRFAAARLRLRGDRLPGPDRGGESRSTFRIMPYFYCVRNASELGLARMTDVGCLKLCLQHGHRESVLTRAVTRRCRMVAIELGMCRSGRNGGSSGSVTWGN